MRDRVRGAARVATIPTDGVQIRVRASRRANVSDVKGGFRIGAGGSFPFGFKEQAIAIALSARIIPRHVLEHITRHESGLRRELIHIGDSLVIGDAFNRAIKTTA